MKWFNLRAGILCVAAAVAMSGSFPVYADDFGGQQAPMVTRHFSGLWDQVDHENQGIALQVVHQFDGSRRAVAYWYTYGEDRQPDWFIGIGELLDNRVEMELYRSEDVGFLQLEDPQQDPVFPIGTMTMEFADCGQGTVNFNTDYAPVGSGSFPVERLAWIHNTQCSGGLSDDVPAGMLQARQRLALDAVRQGLQGSGHADFDRSPGYSALDVEVEGLADGSYRFFVGQHDRGAIVVSGGRGEIGFRSPAESGHGLLNFDPRGHGIEVHDAEGAVLSSGGSHFEEGHASQDHQHNFDCADGRGMGGGMGGGHGGGGMGGGHGGDDCVEAGDWIAIGAEFVNQGVLAQAEGEMTWEMSHERVEFEVEIESVPAGSYPLWVAGVQVGVIETMLINGVNAGEIRFRDPQRPGTEHLDFDPRGQTIEVLQDETVILSAELPAQ